MLLEITGGGCQSPHPPDLFSNRHGKLCAKFVLKLEQKLNVTRVLHDSLSRKMQVCVKIQGQDIQPQ